MKSIYNKTSILLALCFLLIVGSCHDEALYDMGNRRNTGKSILFEVTSGLNFQSAITRSDDDGEAYNELEPMKLPIDNDTLYLHRYISAEYERATGRSASTRALPINNLTDFKSTNNDEGKFLVSAYFPDDNREEYFPFSIATPLSDNLQNPDKDLWSLSSITFWPENKLRFYAVAPASVYNESLLKNLKIDENNTPSISFNYTVPVSVDPETNTHIDALSQPDIMFAINESQYSTTNGGDLANINFRHALSAIKFAVRDVAKFNIVDISIKGVAGSGHCEFTGGDNGSFVWSDLGETTAEYTQRFNYTTTDPYPKIPSTENTTQADLKPIPDEKPEYTFMLIPQSIPSDATIEIKIEYYAETPDNEGPAAEKTTKTLVGRLNPTTSNADQSITEWEAGKEYVYTISTSSENWTYKFYVTGSEQAEKTISGDYYVNGEFKDNEDNIIIDTNVNSGSYYKVISYRHRTNNPGKWEPVAWTAKPSQDGVNEKPTKGPNPTSIQKIEQMLETYKDKINITLPYSQWLLENWKYEGVGSKDYTTYSNLSFSPQYQVTDWEGDWELRTNDLNGDESNPLDLSMVEGSQNTSNCYVINAGGWYSIPLFYGNSIKNSSVNPSSYTGFKKDMDFNSPNYGLQENPSLEKFKDYLNRDIESAAIRDDVDNAVVVWEDAYNVIDNVSFDKLNRRIVFHVNPYNLQQSNSIIAIRDKESRIIWSWHIWITEHWVKKNLRLGDGDVECENWGEGEGNFTISPYNLGWCDPKNSYYMQRRGTLTFTQDQSGKSKTLNIIQREGFIEYWIGNNVYYQYGRKDPLVGFINNMSQVKYNFGDYNYELTAFPTTTSIGEGIQAPYKMFLNYNWLETNYYNLWNNYGALDKIFTGNYIIQSYGDVTIQSSSPELTDSYAFSAVKTIYDPSPVGYVVPPANMFKLFTKGVANPNSAGILGVITPGYFNGEMIPIKNDYYEYYAFRNKEGTDNPRVKFNVSGQRFFTNGTNTNQRVVFLWDNTSNFEQAVSAYGLAIGYEDNTEGTLLFDANAYFPGRKGMGRPVRCVKETNQ